MGTHDHTLYRGAALKTAAQAALTRAGGKWTSARANIFDALTQFNNPASAYDITEVASKTQGRRVAANSVYRILDLFVDANIALRVESANAYIVNAHPDCVHDCIFLVCDGCGKVTHIDDDSLTAGIRTAAEKTGFHPIRPVLEVRGKCTKCQ